MMRLKLDNSVITIGGFDGMNIAKIFKCNMTFIKATYPFKAAINPIFFIWIIIPARSIVYYLRPNYLHRKIK